MDGDQMLSRAEFLTVVETDPDLPGHPMTSMVPQVATWEPSSDGCLAVGVSIYSNSQQGHW